MDDLYLANILEHSKDPHNHGELEKFDVKQDGVNPSCGDEIILYVKFTKDGKVDDVKFTGDGCAISIAATSMLTDKVKHMTKEKILNLTNEDIYELLQVNVNPGREKCALLGLRTLKTALTENP
jgi:nitrogen fixation NifU-like protein